jgi:hypothetical protein
MQAASEIDWGPSYSLDHVDDKVEFFNYVILALYSLSTARHCPDARLRFKSNLGSRHGCLKFSNSVILLMNSNLYRNSPTRDFFTKCFNDAWEPFEEGK